MWPTPTMRVRGVSIRRKASRSSSPASVIGAARTTAPVCPATSCHGTMLLWYIS
jgi:hypothetical protein